MGKKLVCSGAFAAAVVAGFLVWMFRDPMFCPEDGWVLTDHELGRWGFLAADKSPDKSAGQVIHFAGRAVNIKDKYYVLVFNDSLCTGAVKAAIRPGDYPIIIFSTDNKPVEVYAALTGRLVWSFNGRAD